MGRNSIVNYKKSLPDGKLFVCDLDRISSTSFGAFASLMLRSNQVFIHMAKYIKQKKPP